MKRLTTSPLVIATLALIAIAGVLPLDDADARPVRGGARTSVNRGGNYNRNVNRNVSYNRNVNVHRDIDVDVDRHYGGYRGYGYGYGYHPVARAAAAVTTAAVIGSIVYSLPSSCTTVVSGNVAYQRCGSTYYQPRYAGTQVSYVVVNPP